MQSGLLYNKTYWVYFTISKETPPKAAPMVARSVNTIAELILYVSFPIIFQYLFFGISSEIKIYSNLRLCSSTNGTVNRLPHSTLFRNAGSL